MQPRLDDALIEYSFTIEEARMARILDPLKIAYYQTLYAQYFKTRASTPIPAQKELEMEYICRCVELDGKMSMIQELLDNHKEAIKEYNESKQDVAENTDLSEKALAEKASSQVHQIQVL